MEKVMESHGISKAQKGTNPALVSHVAENTNMFSVVEFIVDIFFFKLT